MDVYPSLTYRDVQAGLDYLQGAFGFEALIFDMGDDDRIRAAAVRHGRGMA